MTSGWTCTIVNAGRDIELEQLDDAGGEWFAVGPGGDAIGALVEVLAAVIDDHADPAWITPGLPAYGRPWNRGEPEA